VGQGGRSGESGPGGGLKPDYRDLATESCRLTKGEISATLSCVHPPACASQSMTSTRCSGPQSRRDFLKFGALTLGGLSAAGIVPWKLAADEPGRISDTAVIFIWLPGGPPHMEMYDMKPNAPEEYRGAFSPIRTNVPGIDVCEHLPMHARIADKFTIIRSIAHNFADHGGGHKRFLTGRDPQSPVGFINDHPMVGSMVYRVRGQRPGRVPNYICGTDGGREQIDTFSFGSAYLGPSVHPFT